jgi:hypothetical protein
MRMIAGRTTSVTNAKPPIQWTMAMTCRARAIVIQSMPFNPQVAAIAGCSVPVFGLDQSNTIGGR